MPDRDLDVDIGQRAVRGGDEILARQVGQDAQHARVEHVPGTHLLFDHGFAGFGVIEGHDDLGRPVGPRFYGLG
jgi:hypothetical protein